MEESASIRNLFRTSQDALDRDDWKLAIDSLQRIIDRPEGLLRAPREAGSGLYESPRRRAVRLLATLPPEGLDAYRVLYDGRAKGLLDRARRDQDVSALRRICDRYLLTRYGTEAADLLASWLLDVGRTGEVLTLLQDAESTLIDGRTLPIGMQLKRALALALWGDRAGARRVVAQVRLAEDIDPRDLALADGVAAIVDESDGLADLQSVRGGDWTGPGGGGRCDGFMDPVVPSFGENMPWRQAIPSDFSGLWPDIEGIRPNMLPVGHAAVADGRIFVKVLHGCMAIDTASFAMLWTSPRNAVGIAERAQRRSRLNPKKNEEVLLTDYVAGSLTASDGLVFSIERGESGPSFDAQGVVVLQNNRNSSQDTKDLPTRLVAYQATDGATRWEIGGREEPDERLREAKFLAPAVRAGADLWVPFESSGDLYMEALRPSDGRSQKRLLLCALGGRRVNPRVAMFPAVADGFLYVPSNQGLLFSIDAVDRSIRWASRYRSSPEPKRSRGRSRSRGAGPAGKHWLSGPPVVTGGLVLLAPADDDFLHAMDRLTGKQFWKLPRRNHRYIIAADSEHVWLGGPEISAVSFEGTTARRDEGTRGGRRRDRGTKDLGNPAYEWSIPVSGITGRAVMSGHTIYQPTRTGLLAFDARTGEALDSFSIPSDQSPLGNLLCTKDSMISIDPTEVRAFPDRNSYASTAAAHQADPTDARMAIRLAFMELQNGRPQRALDAIERVEEEAEGDRGGISKEGRRDAESLGQHLVHLRVQSLIRLSHVSGVPPETAVAHLEEAVEAAETRRDRVASRLALGAKLRRYGRYLESYRTLWTLGLSEISDERIVKSTVAPTQWVRRPTRMMVADLLRRIDPELGPGEKETLGELARREFDTAVAKLSAPASGSPGRSRRIREGSSHLRRLAYSGTLGGWDQAALNALGRFELGRGRFERAEQYLMESLRKSGPKFRMAEALLVLLDLYLDPSVSLPSSARDVADRLTNEFGDVVIDQRVVATEVRNRRTKIDYETAAVHDSAGEMPRFVLTSRLAYPPMTDDFPRLIRFGSSRPESLAERMLVYQAPQTLRCFRVADGAFVWETELLMLDDFTYGREEQQQQRHYSGFDDRSALTDGQTAIINSSKGLHAVGTLSGNRLWAEPVRGLEYFHDRILRDRTTDAGSGRVACMLSSGTLSVLRLVDGEEVWQRRLGAQPVGAVRIRDEYVLTADPNIEILHVYRLEDGAELAEIVFRQPNANKPIGVIIPIAYSQGVLCGPDDKAVSAYDARSGERLWTLPLGEDPAGLVEPVQGQVLISTVGGEHVLVDTRTGEVLFRNRVDELPGGATDGVLDSNILILSGDEEVAAGVLWRLVGLDIENGEVRWTREFLGTLTPPNLRAASGVIPAVAMSMPDDDGSDVRSRGPRPQKLLLIDKQTGADVGDPIHWNGDPGAHGQLTGDLAIWPGRIVLQTAKSIVTYETNMVPEVGRKASWTPGAKEVN